ncbi:MAG: 6-phosphofructokinase [Acidobacteria bacterium]|nr:6-phosphofructokinase [Acidobacteriota bacterium]
MQKRKRIGILTGGGDVPGLNVVLKSFAATATEDGHEVLGLRRGWKSLLHLRPGDEHETGEWLVPLGTANTRTIDRSGGTVLHTTRFNPANVARGEVPEHLEGSLPEPNSAGRFDLTRHAMEAIERLRLDTVVVIGGDGTLTFGRRLDSEGVPVIGIPKTVDNDVFGTDYCVGFSTAVTRSVSFINDLRTTAGSHERLLVVELFGRYNGETCLLTAYLSGAHRAVIAEVPFDVERLYELIDQDRRSNPSGYAIVTVSEGAHPVGGERFEHGEADGAGNRRLGGAGEYVARYFEKRSGQRVIEQRLAYLMRSGPPDSFDQLVAKNYGRIAANLAHRGETGKLVASVGGLYAAVPIQKTGEGQRRVDVDRLYDADRFRPLLGAVIGEPMFHV